MQQLILQIDSGIDFYHVNYFGLKVRIPDYFNYLAINPRDNYVWAFEYEPEYNGKTWFADGNSEPLFLVALNGLKPEDSLIDLNNFPYAHEETIKYVVEDDKNES